MEENKGEVCEFKTDLLGKPHLRNINKNGNYCITYSEEKMVNKKCKLTSSHLSPICCCPTYPLKSFSSATILRFPTISFL